MKMKKKILATILVLILLLSNLSVIVNAEWWDDGTGSDLKNIAAEITDNLYADSKFNAETQLVDATKIQMYNWGSYGKDRTNTLKPSDYTEDKIDYTEANGWKHYWYVREFNGNDLVTGNKIEVQGLYFAIQLPQDVTSVDDVATIVYTDGIKFDGKLYDVLINVNKITKTDNSKAEILFKAGERVKSTESTTDRTTYKLGVSPQLGVMTTEDPVQIAIDYKAYDREEDKYIDISGLFGITDIDCNQGVLVNDFVSDEGNTYLSVVAKEANNIAYKKETNLKQTYLYSKTDADTFMDSDKEATEQKDFKSRDNAYLKIEDKNSLGLTFTFNGVKALSALKFDRYFKVYHKIETEVEPADRATITESILNITDGETKTIEFSPSNPVKQYLKSIEIDDEVLPKANLKDTQGKDITSYIFRNITENHKIKVVYGDIYNIEYVLNGGENDPTNPSTYTSEDDDIIFKNPTRPGYDFLGWYETPTFDEDTERDSIATGSTGDVKVYAKWQASKDTKYTVYHYLENENGYYELEERATDVLTAETDTEVTAKPKAFENYVENTKIDRRVPSGKVTADGSLVLKLYYDRVKFRVTFEPKNDTEIDDQIVKYLNTATEPTKPVKDGYTFEYWYYIDENNKEQKYNFNTKVTRDYDLIAKWKEVEKTTPKKEDPTTADKDIPNSGKEVIILPIACVVIVVGFVFGKKYINLKRDIK